MLDAVWLWELYYSSLGLHPKSCKLYFDTCKSLFGDHVAGFSVVVDEILAVEIFFRSPSMWLKLVLKILVMLFSLLITLLDNCT